MGRFLPRLSNPVACRCRSERDSFYCAELRIGRRDLIIRSCMRVWVFSLLAPLLVGLTSVNNDYKPVAWSAFACTGSMAPPWNPLEPYLRFLSRKRQHYYDVVLQIWGFGQVNPFQDVCNPRFVSLRVRVLICYTKPVETSACPFSNSRYVLSGFLQLIPALSLFYFIFPSWFLSHAFLL